MSGKVEETEAPEVAGRVVGGVAEPHAKFNGETGDSFTEVHCPEVRKPLSRIYFSDSSLSQRFYEVTPQREQCL